jgi:hypothetical protein
MCISLIHVSIGGATVNDDVLKITGRLGYNAFDSLSQTLGVIKVNCYN